MIRYAQPHSNDTAGIANIAVSLRSHLPPDLVPLQPAGHKFLITEFGEAGDGQYVDPRGKIVVQFDHIKQQVAGQAGAASLDASIEPSACARAPIVR